MFSVNLTPQPPLTHPEGIRDGEGTGVRFFRTRIRLVIALLLASLVFTTAPGGIVFAATPTVTSVSPSSGTTLGGTSVTITGTNLTGATTVTFGGTNATNVVVTNATTITATAPAHAAGAVTVTVTTAEGTGSKTSALRLCRNVEHHRRPRELLVQRDAERQSAHAHIIIRRQHQRLDG